jgi:hypothetical protein
LKILGYNTDKFDNKTFYFKDSVTVPSYLNSGNTTLLKTLKNPKKIKFKFNNKTYSSEVINWPRPTYKKINPN